MPNQRGPWERAINHIEQHLQKEKHLNVNRGLGAWPRLVVSNGKRTIEIECHSDQQRGPRLGGKRVDSRSDLFVAWVVFGGAGGPTSVDVVPSAVVVKRLRKTWGEWTEAERDATFRDRWDLLGFG